MAASVPAICTAMGPGSPEWSARREVFKLFHSSLRDVTISLTRAQKQHTAIIALGANLGDPKATLAQAVKDLGQELEILKVSPLAITKPVGGPPDQPDYTNQVIEVRTRHSAHELLDLCQGIETKHHRTREVRWGPRTLDVDVVTVDEVRSTDPVLTLPHPRAHERAFVLVPWLDVQPDATLAGRPVRELLAALAPGEVAAVRLVREELR